MVTYKSIQYRFWASLLILLYLVALLLSPSTKIAAAQGNDCTDTPLQSASASAGVVPAADQQVVIPKDTVDQSVFEANWRLAYQDAAAVESLMWDQFAIRIADGQTHVDNVMSEFVRKYEQAIPPEAILYRNLYPYDEVIHTTLDVALDMPELAPHVRDVWKSIGDPDHLTIRLPDSATKVAQSANRYGLGQRLLDRAPEILKKIRDCAQKKPEVAEAFDKRHRTKLKTGIRDNAKTMIQQNTNLAILIDIQNRLQADGTISISLDELKTLSESEFAKLHTSLDEMKQTLIEIDKKQDVIVDYIKNQQEKEKMQELAKKKAEEYQLKLDAIKSSISILTTITAQIDPKLAKEIGVVGNSALQVGTAINSWLKAVSGLNGLNKVFSLSTVVMTGNVLGAVMNVVSLFGDDKPSPEQMILEEIGKLRQQIEQLRGEMHSRFDRIDAELNTIYTTMHERFDQIDIQLGKINGNILEVQQSLVGLDLKLSRIERNNFELLNTLGRRPLLEAINGGLGYRKRVGSPMPEAYFVQIENQFHSWATLHAFDPVNAGPTQRDYSDSGLLTELNAYPFDANLNYLNGWLVVHDLPAIANQPLPSARDWLLASRAYTQLALEEPERMATFIQNDPQRQARLNQIGVELETAMHNLSTRLTPTGTLGNSLLFTTAITLYQSKLNAIDSELQTLETAFVNEMRAGLQRNEPFDLYGGVDQPLTFQAARFQQISYGDMGQTLPAPGNLAAHIAGYNRYNLAEYFAISNTAQISVSIFGVLSNARPQPGCTPDPDICPMMGDLEITLGVHYGTVLIAGLEFMAGRTTLQVVKGDLESATDYVVRNWGSLRGRFEAGATAIAPSLPVAAQRAALLTDLASRLEERLASYQQALYGRARNDLTAGSLKLKAVELAGSKALIDSLVTLGLPRAVSSDEFVHAMLFGNQQLVNDHQIVESYAISFTRPITMNPRLALRQTADQRTEAFAGLINEYLDAITAQEHIEAPDYIANTRRALDLTVRIVQLEVPLQTQTISFNPLPDKRLGDPPFSVNATASSGLPVSFTSNTPAVCTVSGNTVTLIATGTCSITATQEGNAQINPATPVTQSFVVSPQGGGGSERRLYLPVVVR
jgi:hypothetical protein